MSEPLKVDEEARCDRCGGFSPFDLGDRRLCEECYRLCGSCCPEFGADDLWPREDDPPVAAVLPGALQNGARPTGGEQEVICPGRPAIRAGRDS